MQGELGKELPVTSIRTGSVPGTHELIFDAPFEQITLRHEARDRRVFADGLGPDGITMDAEGAVWVSAGGFSVVRVAEGGRILQRVGLAENRAPFALMLGGPDRRTLFICTAEWRLADGHVANLERLATGPRTGEILALPVEVPGTGRP